MISNTSHKIVIPLLMTLLTLSTSCRFLPKWDKTFPDPRDSYVKSKALAELEIPPDLSNERVTHNPHLIVDDTINNVDKIDTAHLPTTEDSAFNTNEKKTVLNIERSLVVAAPIEKIWPTLEVFFEQRNLTLNDKEIGVMETNWEQYVDASIRSRYRVFVQSTSVTQTTLLLVGLRESKVTSETTAEWVKTPIGKQERERIKNLEQHILTSTAK